MKHGRVLLVLLVLAGCVVATGASSAAPAPSCLRAEDFGAVPDDGQDDRDRLQAAIDAAQAGPRCLELGPGRFHATRRQTPGTSSIASLRITGSLVLRGAGEGVTVLAMLGPGTCSGCQGFPNPTDWHLLAVTGATDVSISGLTFDGSERTNTIEQTHLLQVNGPTDNVLIEHATFNLPIIGPNAGGDCIRLLGTHTEWVRNTTIRHTRGLDCDRSFIGIQRGLDGVVIEHSESVLVGDQAIDFEPTGGPSFECQPIVKNILMRQLVLRRGVSAGLTATIHGDGCAVAENVTLTDSTVEDGTVSILDARDVTLSRLRLRSLPGNPAPIVLARKRIENLRILDSELERLADSGTGQALKISGQNGAFPTDVLLSGVRITQATPGPLVSTEHLARLVIVGAELVYTGPPVGNHAVHVRGFAEAPAEAPVLVDTTVAGALAGAARVAGVFTGQPVLVRVTGP
ncbi:MAG TPA: hypothetical protein VGX25_26815 [Actinophytocola sp.]|uniref:hypothetical protein n=1 Tax=Actinophytocola sp. TaxID=1872138 RepID=UPI002DDD148B|nr:hypothetical protein [Actinophytocola sp.]HEV2783015.1 hypothetical protein [Actinophytocola sp.]